MIAAILQDSFGGVTLRESCYHCLYAKPERGSDLTIGDFIGLGCKTTFPYDVHNVSSVFVNSVTGEKFYREMSDCMSRESAYQSIQRDYGERLEYKPSLMEPFARHKLVEKFRRLYRKHGYQVAIEKTVGREIAMRKLKRVLRGGVRRIYAAVNKVVPLSLLGMGRVAK